MTTGSMGYPLAGERSGEALIGGWVLYLIAGVIPLVPLVPLAGYYLRVLGRSAEGADTPPALAEPLRLIRQGVVGTGVTTIYITIPVALLAVTAGGLPGTSRPAGPVGTMIVLAGGTTLLVGTLLFLYLLPAALAAYGRTGDPRRPFDATMLRGVGGHAAYFYRFWLGATGFLFATAVGGWLWTRHPIGQALSPLPMVYGQLVACHVWGKGVARATGNGVAGAGE